MTAFDFATDFLGSLECMQEGFEFGIWRYTGTHDHAYGTPGGRYNPENHPGFHFTSDDYDLLIRSIPENSRGESYLVIESFSTEGQLANINLGRKLTEENGTTTITENFTMTVGYGQRKRQDVEAAFRSFGFQGHTIATFVDANVNWQIVLEQILSWAATRDEVKYHFQNLEAPPEPLPQPPPPDSIGSNQHSLPSVNTILYGPPGTGKTYNTIRKAAEIITGELYDTKERYELAKQIFKNESGKQIEFITFHQNYSYEDFVAGLRPDIDAASIGLRFVEHRGIFYKICERAKENYEQHTSGQTFIEPTFEEVLEVFLQPLIEDDEIEVATIARNVTFHIIGNNSGKNLSFRKKDGGTQHTLSISTLKDLYYERREYSLQGLGIYFRPVVDKLKKIAAGLRQETGKIALKKFVLIIDEINRANISRVFGELITLLEPDKRLGAANELRLRLPGLPGEELFCIPSNLYIIGTMNTADKSIALLDIALRRRFVFEDMYPREEIIDELIQPPYNQFLKALNKKIMDERSADFLIGHAYFITHEGEEFDFLQVMNRQVIPLLNEYFYNSKTGFVFNLLKEAIVLVAGFTIEHDIYLGVIVKAAE